jgi:hypothetical protein
MRAVQITRFGGPEVLDVVDLPDPVPGDGQQLYDVSTAGINFADTRVHTGEPPGGQPECDPSYAESLWPGVRLRSDSGVHPREKAKRAVGQLGAGCRPSCRHPDGPAA